MKLLICTALAIAGLYTCSYAKTALPARFIASKSFTASIKKIDSLASMPKLKSRVCACQLLQVQSGNEKDKYLAVLAQRTNNGKLSADFILASSIIEKEKKHLKSFFYTDIKVVERKVEATDCSLLYANLKARYANVRLYEILDADALNNTRRTKKQ